MPCQQDPEMWFGIGSKHCGPRTPDETDAAEHAKQLCVQECPAAERRRCARQALQSGERHGIWAGVELPHGKLPAKIRNEQLAAARKQLETIANE